MLTSASHPVLRMQSKLVALPGCWSARDFTLAASGRCLAHPDALPCSPRSVGDPRTAKALAPAAPRRPPSQARPAESRHVSCLTARHPQDHRDVLAATVLVGVEPLKGSATSWPPPSLSEVEPLKGSAIPAYLAVNPGQRPRARSRTDQLLRTIAHATTAPDCRSRASLIVVGEPRASTAASLRRR